MNPLFITVLIAAIASTSATLFYNFDSSSYDGRNLDNCPIENGYKLCHETNTCNNLLLGYNSGMEYPPCLCPTDQVYDEQTGKCAHPQQCSCYSQPEVVIATPEQFLGMNGQQGRTESCNGFVEQCPYSCQEGHVLLNQYSNLCTKREHCGMWKQENLYRQMPYWVRPSGFPTEMHSYFGNMESKSIPWTQFVFQQKHLEEYLTGKPFPRVPQEFKWHKNYIDCTIHPKYSPMFLQRH